MSDGSAVETRLMVVRRITKGTVLDGTKVFNLGVYFPVPVEVFHTSCWLVLEICCFIAIIL